MKIIRTPKHWLPIVVGALILALLATTPVNAQDSNGQISGSVTDTATGTGIADILVMAYTSPDAVSTNQDPVAKTLTMADGSYLLTDVPAGSYVIRFNSLIDGGYNPAYYQQFYNGMSYINDTMGPTYVTVAQGETATGIDAHLTRLLPTITTLTASANPARIGQKLTLTAVVSQAQGGMMIYKDNGQLIDGCGFTLFQGTTATCALSFSSAGTHTITAEFAGDATYAPSSSQLVVTVKNAPATISQCLNGGWRHFTEPTFKNQLQCVLYVVLTTPCPYKPLDV